MKLIILVMFVLACTPANHSEDKLEKIRLSEHFLFDAEFEKGISVLGEFMFDPSKSSFEKMAIYTQYVRVLRFQANVENRELTKFHLISIAQSYLSADSVHQNHIETYKFYTMIAGLYDDLAKKSIYYQKASDGFNKLHNLYWINYLESILISNKQIRYIKNNDVDSAKLLVPDYMRLIEDSKKSNNIYSLSFNTRHLAKLYDHFNLDLNKAEHYYTASLNQRLEIGFKPYTPASYLSLADLYVKLEKFDEAISHYKNTIESADDVGFIRQQFNGRFRLAKLYLKLGKEDLGQDMLNEAKIIAESNLYERGINEYDEFIMSN